MKRSKFTVREGLVMLLGVTFMLIVMLWLSCLASCRSTIERSLAKQGNRTSVMEDEDRF